VFLLLGLLACAEAPVAVPKPPQPAEIAEASVPHADLLATADARIDASRRAVGKYPGQWLRHEELAGAHLARARLVAGLDDFAAAEGELARAFEIAPKGSGPWLTQARLDYALHRLDRVEISLAAFEGRILIDDPHRAEVARIRGDVALQRGDHADARARYVAAEALKRTEASCFGAVQLHWWEARFDEAKATLDSCEGLVVGDNPTTRAWYDLQRGLISLDAEQLAAAEQHYLDATEHVTGWYLVDEHLAEVRALQGDTAAAEAGYRDIVARTGGPEFMDALAELLIATGREVEGRDWAAKADAAWRKAIARYPEAAFGHALEHFLAFGKDPAETLEFARLNVAARPNGPARALLARALLRAGDPAAAKAEVEGVLATSYRSAALAALAAELGVHASE